MPDIQQLPLTHTSAYGITGIAALVIFVKMLHRSKLDAIPTVGPSGWLHSWWAGWKFSTNAPDIIQEGYEKHKSAPFKVSQFYRWLVVISSREHVDELRRAPADVLSFSEAVNDFINVKYTLGPEFYHNPYHIAVVRGPLTRSIGALYPPMKNEMVTAFDEVLDLSGNEWKSVEAVNSIKRVVCRMSNRAFVGLPLCCDAEWVDLNIRFILDVARGSFFIGLFPNFLKPMISRFCTASIRRSKMAGRRLLGPIIEERQRYIKEYGNEWADKPNDLLSWVMDAAEGPESTIECLTTRMLTINFSAIMTTSHSLGHALFYLAENPQYIKPLREEVESIVEKEGWSKASLGKMPKLNSFIRECQRFEGLGVLNMMRKAMKDFTFSDGTFIPKGTTINVAIGSIHHDNRLYPNAHVFEPFRFADMCNDDAEGTKYDLASTSTEYLTFGHGRFACPGRFFAACELKSILAHIVVTYDVKLPENMLRPKSLRFGISIVPSPSARVMFRKRVHGTDSE